MSKDTYQHIIGYASQKRIYEKKIKVSCFPRIKDLLKALTAKACLTNDEIVGAYAKKRTKIANSFLEIREDATFPSVKDIESMGGMQNAFQKGKHRHHLSCGNNPYFVAKLIYIDE